MTRESGRWSTGIQVLYRDVATDLYLTRAVGGHCGAYCVWIHVGAGTPEFTPSPRCDEHYTHGYKVSSFGQTAYCSGNNLNVF